MIVGVGVIGLILLVNFLMNDRIISEADIEKYLGIPALAVLPDKDPCETDKRRKQEHEHECWKKSKDCFSDSVFMYRGVPCSLLLAK